MSPGNRAWCALAVGVGTYDWCAITFGWDTMSQAFLNALEDPKRKHATTLFWVYLVAHLFGVIPKGYDPLRKVEK